MCFEPGDYLCYQTLVYLHFLVCPLDLDPTEEAVLNKEFTFYTGMPQIYRDESAFLSRETKPVWFLSTQRFTDGKTRIMNRKNRANNPNVHFQILKLALQKHAAGVKEMLLKKDAKKRFDVHFELYYHLDVRNYPTGPWIEAANISLIHKYNGSLGIYAKYVKAPPEEPA